MSWMSAIFGRPAPHVKASSLSRDEVRPAPTDPTLESAAKETSLRVKSAADEIDRLAKEIVEMTDGFLKQFEAKNDEPRK